MRLSRIEPASIASRLVWLFTITAALVLSCGLGVLYVIVVRHAFAEDRAFLADKVAALRNDLAQAGGMSSITDQLAQSGRRSTYWVRLLDSGGRTVAETPGMADLLPQPVFPGPGEDNAAASSEKRYQVDGQLFALATTPVDVAHDRYLLQVAQDRSPDRQFSREFGALLMGVLILGIAAAMITAKRVTRHGLRPLQTMRAALERITPTHLGERVASPEWPSELQPLAVAFDGMLDRLENSFNRLSQFSADLAHELRTPVGNILGESQVALTRPRDAHEYRQVIESNAAECQRLAGIIENLLFLARAEAAEERVQRTRFDARQAVHEIAAFYQPVAEEQRVAVETSGHGYVYADAHLFRRALSNLVDNALRFTSSAGRIRINIAEQNSHTSIEVSDTGCGIPAEHIPHVFERFYRADRSRGSDGTGLGLALVKSIMEMHGGTAVVTSEPGRGTNIILRFPAASATA